MLSVAASDSTGSSAPFSNFNATNDVSAPGVGVYAAIAKGFDFAGGGVTPTCDPLPGVAQPGWCQVDGTSFSAPIAAAAAAWIWSARRGLTPFQLADVLREGARPGHGQVGGFDAHFGFGLVDVTRSLQAKPPTPDVLEPNGDIPMINGKAGFGKAQRAVLRASQRMSHVSASADFAEDYEDVYRVDVPRGAKKLKVALRHRGSGRRTDDLNVCVWASTVRYVQVEDVEVGQGAARLLQAEGRDVRLADDQAEARHAARVRRRLRADGEQVRQPLHADPVEVVAPVQPRVFCPFCATRLGPIAGAAQECPGCGRPFYHNAAPCSAVVVEDDGRVLLARRAADPGAGLWDLPGGFCEPGETPEEGAVRELREETGADIEVTGFLAHLVDTYGEAGDPTLNCVFRARLVGEPVLTAADDVAELRWFAPDELPPRAEIAFENTAEALRRWRRA